MFTKLIPATSERTMQYCDPWKEDGDVVISAQGKYHFRVHRSVLCAHSEVFKTMVAFLDTDKAEEKLIDQCPVIDLHDTATDIQIILKALYDRSYPCPYYNKTHFSVVAAFLRLGDKYGIPALVKEAKGRLRPRLEPCSYVPIITPRYGYASSDLFTEIHGSDPYNFQIMNLLQEMGLKSPLPVAMYECFICSPMQNILDGYNFNGSVCSLSSENLRSFIRMKEVLDNCQVELAGISFTNRCGQASCMSNFCRVWPEAVAAPPLSCWKFEWKNLFCEICARDLMHMHNAARTKAWDQVPTAFGFESWEEVKKSSDLPWRRFGMAGGLVVNL